MGRALRHSPGGLVYHVLNRASGRGRLFAKDDDFGAFEQILAEALPRVGMRLLSYCLLPTHWHLVLLPRADGDLSRFVGWVTLTHTQRRRAQHRSASSGHFYQGRFKSFPVQQDEHLWMLARHVERSPITAGLADRAKDWRWGSFRRWTEHRDGDELISAWPTPRPSDWTRRVNAATSAADEEALHASVTRGRPFGDPGWQSEISKQLGLESTFRPPGRPAKARRNGA
jgi:putative transposase